MEMSLGSVGGFCAGSSFVVQHQVLSGQGYCFSASLPPLLAVSAREALNIIESDSGELFTRLQDKCKLVHKMLGSINDYTLTGDEISPVKHLRLSFDNNLANLQKIVDFAQKKDVSFTVARYLKEELYPPKPSIRVSVNIDLTETEIDLMVKVLEEALKVVQ
jgi:serine palmitoyltransferase